MERQSLISLEIGSIIISPVKKGQRPHSPISCACSRAKKVAIVSLGYLDFNYNYEARAEDGEGSNYRVDLSRVYRRALVCAKKGERGR